MAGPDERRLLFRRTPQGLEPLALWLTPGGMPKKAHGWEDTFQAANARVSIAWVRAGGKAEECPLWCRPHMCRHAFITAALDAGVPLRDVQEAASHTGPRTTTRYDRARTSLDRHATYIVAAFIAGTAR